MHVATVLQFYLQVIRQLCCSNYEKCPPKYDTLDLYQLSKTISKYLLRTMNFVMFFRKCFIIRVYTENVGLRHKFEVCFVEI